MSPPPSVDPEKLRQVLLLARQEVETALWLSCGMVFAVAAVVCMALHLRRCALACGLLYSASLCFVHNGHAQVLGPFGCAAAALGFLWPRRQRAP